MIKLRESDIKQTYFITSADWESVVESTSFDNAVSSSLEEAFNIIGEDLNLSTAIIVVDMTNFCLNFNETHTKVFSTPEVLANIGKHNLAKTFKNMNQ
jgi:hypothetical protein